MTINSLMFFGIDLTSKETKPSACLALDDELKVAYFGSVNEDRDIFSTINRFLPAVVAIDAPLSLPLGLCCLEENCPCQPRLGRKGRQCERELAELGIPCYFTTKKSIIKEMVYRGIRLKGELDQCGYKVIEVYPYGSKARLFGKAIPRKTKPEGLAFLKERLTGVIPGLAPHLGKLNHDLCDAAMAAYTAFLYFHGKTEPLGDGGEGVIYIPLSNYPGKTSFFRGS